MNCEEARRRLDELENGRDPAPELAAHWASCPRCREEHQRFAADLEALRALSAASPRRDLWPEIAERLGRRAPSGGAWRWRVAAGVLLATGLVGWLTSRPQPVLRTPRPEEIRVVPWQELLATSSAQATEQLAARQPELPQESTAALTENLHRIEGAIAEIERAIAAHPENRELELLLASRVRQQARLIQRISLV